MSRHEQRYKAMTILYQAFLYDNNGINYDINDKVESLDYEMIYDSVDLFNKACLDSKDKNPTCEDMKVKYTEKDEITTSFSKDDIKNMLYIIGAKECK